MELPDLLTAVFAYIEEDGMTHGLEAYIAAAKRGDTDDAWAALSEEEQTTVQVAYSRATRLETAA